MRFKKAILIPIYVYTEDEMELQDLGMDNEDESGFEKTEIRAFWCIDYANQFRDDSNKTCFYLNGESFVTPQTIKGFVNLINAHIELN